MAAAYDVIVVGARCAGAPLASHLARAGARVALLEAASLPSDQPMSTHLLQPPALDELDRLGLGDRVRGLTPAIQAGRFTFDDEEMVMRYGAGRAAYCLRRDILDPMLQENAAAAGADLQEQSRVVGLDRNERGRVCGVKVKRRSGMVEALGAALVVGADGRNSSVARLTGAREYLAYDAPRAAYWAYWKRPRSWNASMLYNGRRGTSSHVLFPTGADQVLIATSPPVSEAWHGDHDSGYARDLCANAALASVVEGARPISRVRVLGRTRYFFRQSAGPGWVLAGDAGHHKEFFVGFGITDALRDAAALAAAIAGGAGADVERYWRQRDCDRMAMYQWGRQMGRAAAVSPLERLIARRAAVSPEITSRFAAVIDAKLPPSALFPPSRILAWTVGEAARGNTAPLAKVPGKLVETWKDFCEIRRRRRELDAHGRERRQGLEAPRTEGMLGAACRHPATS